MRVSSGARSICFKKGKEMTAFLAGHPSPIRAQKIAVDERVKLFESFPTLPFIQDLIEFNGNRKLEVLVENKPQKFAQQLETCFIGTESLVITSLGRAARKDLKLYFPTGLASPIRNHVGHKIHKTSI